MVVCSKVESRKECILGIIDRIMTSFRLERFVKITCFVNLLGFLVKYTARIDFPFWPL